ncbi:uncharacterized protein LOC143608588 [Bidens hawaiensis]|uniref:uncharacterized protein LOC143608588 n=1 Tax=Bidens hawaiensis TaxID=980011 RepID=UPI004049806D
MEKALAHYGVTHRTSTTYHTLKRMDFCTVMEKALAHWRRRLELSCHLSVELEHRAYWALKTMNVDLTAAARKRYFQIHELEELWDAAYSRSLNFKEETKALHDRRFKGGK